MCCLAFKNEGSELDSSCSIMNSLKKGIVDEIMTVNKFECPTLTKIGMRSSSC